MANAIAGRWYDEEGVDLILGIGTSSCALAVNNLTRAKNKVMISTGAATTDLTGAQCSPNTVHWSYDTYMTARSTGGTMVKAGGDSWFFISANYVFRPAIAARHCRLRHRRRRQGAGLGQLPVPRKPPISAP